MKPIEFIANILGKRYARTLKQLGNAVITLTRFTYATEVLPSTDNYMITDKAEGERAFFMVRDGRGFYLTSTATKFLAPINLDTTILDCELVDGTLYVFDVIMYNGTKYSDRPFAERHKVITTAIAAGSIHPSIVAKNFFALKSTGEAIKKLLAAKRPYEIDGIIFTSLDADYRRTQNYKWKPPEKNTIDFLVIRDGKNYILFNGISTKEQNCLGFPLPKNYAALVASCDSINIAIEGGVIKQEYFPVPFQNSLRAVHVIPASLFSDADLHGKVAELCYIDGKWKLYKVRDDRQNELHAGTYYGNNYKIAELTLQLSLNPLLLEHLTASSGIAKDNYFKKQDDKYFHVRKFNNYIKDMLIRTHKKDVVLDLASGKGQDLLKYWSAGVGTLYNLEIDNNAIDELVRRKYEIFNGDLRGSHVIGAPPKCLLHIKCVDLTTDDIYKQVIGVKFPLIICNFALHYLLFTPAGMLHACKVIADYLAPGGSFIFTALDGAKVFKLLTAGPWKVGDRYSISYSKGRSLTNPGSKGKSKGGTAGQSPAGYKGFEKISVLLPCSDEPYEEPLINLFALDVAFKKHNIQRVEERGFLEAYNSAIANSKFDKLDADDIKFIDLYKYVIYRRI